jgi:glycerate dehydrogenase
VLGVIGAGSIGTEIIEIGRGLGMSIICNTKNPSAKRAKKLGIEKFSELEEVLRKADFVVLAIPANKETEHIINKKSLKMMKETAYLVNPARAQLVDTLALAEAIYNQDIAGAALDMIETEPFDIREADLRIQEMVNSFNVIVTPHIAWNTKEAAKRLEDRVVEAVKRIV